MVVAKLPTGNFGLCMGAQWQPAGSHTTRPKRFGRPDRNHARKDGLRVTPSQSAASGRVLPTPPEMVGCEGVVRTPNNGPSLGPGATRMVVSVPSWNRQSAA